MSFGEPPLEVLVGLKGSQKKTNHLGRFPDFDTTHVFHLNVASPCPLSSCALMSGPAWRRGFSASILAAGMPKFRSQRQCMAPKRHICKDERHQDLPVHLKGPRDRSQHRELGLKGGPDAIEHALHAKCVNQHPLFMALRGRNPVKDASRGLASVRLPADVLLPCEAVHFLSRPDQPSCETSPWMSVAFSAGIDHR